MNKYICHICGAIGFLIGTSFFYPDQVSAIATLMASIGGILILYFGIKEFEIARNKYVAIYVKFPYLSALENESIPFNNDTSFLSGSIINSGLRKIILVDGGIRTVTEEFEASGEKYTADINKFNWIGDTLDGENWGGIKIEFPIELASDECINFKINREPNLNTDILMNEKFKYFVIWVKEVSGETFYKIMKTPYYHDNKDKNNLKQGK